MGSRRRKGKKKFGARDFLLYFVMYIPAHALVCLYFAPDYFLAIVSAYRWQPVLAQVESTEIQYSPLMGFFNRHYRYEPLVHYKFSVNGVSYEGSRLSLPAGERYRSDAEQDVRDYHPGQMVWIYYDPYSPATSAIVKPTYLWLYIAIAAGVLTMALTIITVLYQQRKGSAKD